ncbi:hypothetical protein K438DRAFT_1979855 [Mycena galopus ATCC 62051]|nr:hypothetical protein K438DRAFT_1979855 [Mycena galopus ATCC 62051]
MKTRAPSRKIHAGAHVPTRAVQGGSLKKPAERRRTGEAKRVTAAVVDADDGALGQDRPQPLLDPIIESYTSAATLTVEAPEKVAARRHHNEDMDSPSSAAFVSHPNTSPLRHRRRRRHSTPGRGSEPSCVIQARRCPPRPLAGLEELVHAGELLCRPIGKGVQRLRMARPMFTLSWRLLAFRAHDDLSALSSGNTRRASKLPPSALTGRA